MMEMEDLPIEEAIELCIDSRPSCLENHAKEELLSPHNSSSEENHTNEELSSPHNSSSEENHTNEELSSSHNSSSEENQTKEELPSPHNSLCEENHTKEELPSPHNSSSEENHTNEELPSPHNSLSEEKQVTTQVMMIEQTPIKAEENEDHLPADYDPFSEEEMLKQHPIKEEDSDTDVSSSEELELSLNSSPGKRSVYRITILKKDSQNPDSVIDICDADKMDLSNGDGGTSAENTVSSKEERGVLALETDMEHETDPSASPDLEKVPQIKREKKSLNGSANLDITTNIRQKRKAFKKCTEWFKLLIGEREANYICTTCSKEFSSKRNLKEHERVHSVSYPVNRSEQVSQPNQANVMTERLETQNELTALSCKDCGKTFQRKDFFLKHVRSHSDSSPKEVREKVTVLRTPVSRIRKFQCDECDARFTQKWSLEQHQLIHSKVIEGLECKECNEKFSDIKLLVKHEESHSGQKSYGCGECDERFDQKSTLFKHQLAHVERRKSECSECDLQFTDRSELKIHSLTVHGTENLCVCTQCNKAFSKRGSLKRHLLTHREKKGFECHLCKELFAQKSTLTRHLLLHGGEKFYRFVCSVCARKFSRRETLADHIRTHTGERPFVCGVCNEGFTQKSAMKRHQILHFKEKRGKNSLPPVEVDTGTTDDILLSLVYNHSEKPL